MASRQRSRLRRTLLAALVTASVAVPTAGAARPAAVPAPAPAELGPLARVTAAALDARYAANRDAVRAAERTAADYGDRKRAAALRAMAGPNRHFLSFDGRDGGRSVEVVGDLASAEHIAVLVPGSDTALGSERFRDGAVALQRQLGERAAVLAWLGYATPATASAAAVTPGRAEEAAPGLRAFVGELRTAKPAARLTLLCHSYGSVVCAKAAPGLPVAGIVLYGSPGTGADSAAELRTAAPVWAGRGESDWIARVPHLRVPLPFGELGFGTDPLAPEFGARVFDAGDGGHSDYLVPGSVPLKQLASIVMGREPADA
ncbi:alpha/beta hydrolase family protein [Streptomyces sp. Je 1-79]|uniref:alpha/beta hydrolase family protein n=1 Tax=Streptomyces sp. Je 1-79 TaxID=2943847 RepID=UPI0021A7EAAA|nr:alpha/beta hydrolase family protein [Streptomyces sp. Je 1-79]MCT4357587.1 alpha/beta hydrolase family protein [Streptomyces sp. Je 1-79]